MQLISLAVYLEYNIRFPLTGGEFHYVSYRTFDLLVVASLLTSHLLDRLCMETTEIFDDIHVLHHVCPT
jgi:hypothetical protein